MRVGSACGRRAARQHGHFVRALERSGASVTRVPFVHGAFDSVFMKDNAVLVERSSGRVEALCARPVHRERVAEQSARCAALHAHGVDVTTQARNHLEGGDVVIARHAPIAFLGYGFRSSLRALDDLECFLDCDVVPLELVDPRLYHLDTAFALLEDGTALVCSDAFTPRSRRLIEELATSLIRVPLREALSFAANIVQIGNTIHMGSAAPVTTRLLRARGYKVASHPLDQFHEAGGSAACLVARVHRLGALAATVAA